MPAFMVEIAVIFAREFLEGSVIIGQYRNVVKAQTEWDEARKRKSMCVIWLAALAAAVVAILFILFVGIGLHEAGNELEDEAKEIIEGVSKLVAAVCIAQLSLKMPVWLGVYPKPAKEKKLGLTLRELWFNVAWNIWREIAEIGAFLVPFFLEDEAQEAIPLSGAVGLLIGVACGALIYGATKLMKSRSCIAFFLAFITGWLSTGLFCGGCHEIEEAAGETEDVWEIEDKGWSNKQFPMVMFKPFGWAHEPTELWIGAFVSWACMLVLLHVCKYQWLKRKARLADEKAAASEDGKVAAEEDGKAAPEQEATSM